jgi:transcriptional regulator with XRE-family HTH domain
MTVRKVLVTKVSDRAVCHIALCLRSVASERAQAIGENVRRYREAAGLSLRALAAKAGVHRNTVLNTEKGKGITVDTLERIAAALSISFEDLALLPVSELETGPLVDRFLKSHWAKMLELKEDEIRFLQSASLVKWVGASPSEKALYLLILAQRERMPPSQ